MKTICKSLGILLSVCMLCTLLAGTVSADEPLQADAFHAVPSGTGSFSYYAIADSATDRIFLTDDSNNDGTPDRFIGNYPTSGTGVPTWDQIYKGATTPFYISCNDDLDKGVPTSGKMTTDETGTYRLVGGVKFYPGKIYLGYPSSKVPMLFEKGIGTHPGSSSFDSSTWTYQMFNVEGFERFYAAVGITGKAAIGEPQNGSYVDNGVIFEVYGSTKLLGANEAADSSLVLLATSGEINSHDSGEFLVDITGYKTLKLVTRIPSDNASEHSSCASAWGNVSVYNPATIETTAPPTEEPTEAPTTAPTEEATTAPTSALEKPTVAPATEPAADSAGEESDSPVGLIIGIAVAVLVVAGVVVVIIIKKKKAA